MTVRKEMDEGMEGKKGEWREKDGAQEGDMKEERMNRERGRGRQDLLRKRQINEVRERKKKGQGWIERGKERQRQKSKWRGKELKRNANKSKKNKGRMGTRGEEAIEQQVSKGMQRREGEREKSVDGVELIKERVKGRKKDGRRGRKI